MIILSSLKVDRDYSTAHNFTHELQCTRKVCVINSILFFLIFRLIRNVKSLQLCHYKSIIVILCICERLKMTLHPKSPFSRQYLGFKANIFFSLSVTYVFYLLIFLSYFQLFILQFWTNCHRTFFYSDKNMSTLLFSLSFH